MSDIQFPNGTLGTGTFTVEIKDNNGDPSDILSASEPFDIVFTWIISRRAALYLSGTWLLDADVESIGRGPERSIIVPPVTVALDGGRHYTRTVTAPANTFPSSSTTGASGVYKLAFTLSHDNTFGARTQIAGLAESDLLRID